jgi:hypothetical protein
MPRTPQIQEEDSGEIDTLRIELGLQTFADARARLSGRQKRTSSRRSSLLRS